LAGQARKLINLPQNKLLELENHLPLADHASATPLVARSPVSSEDSPSDVFHSIIDHEANSSQQALSMSPQSPYLGYTATVEAVVIDEFDELLSCVQHCASDEETRTVCNCFVYASAMLSDCQATVTPINNLVVIMGLGNSNWSHRLRNFIVISLG